MIDEIRLVFGVMAKGDPSGKRRPGLVLAEAQTPQGVVFLVAPCTTWAVRNERMCPGGVEIPHEIGCVAGLDAATAAMVHAAFWVTREQLQAARATWGGSIDMDRAPEVRRALRAALACAPVQRWQQEFTELMATNPQVQPQPSRRHVAAPSRRQSAR